MADNARAFKDSEALFADTVDFGIVLPVTTLRNFLIGCCLNVVCLKRYRKQKTLLSASALNRGGVHLRRLLSPLLRKLRLCRLETVTVLGKARSTENAEL